MEDASAKELQDLYTTGRGSDLIIIACHKAVIDKHFPQVREFNIGLIDRSEQEVTLEESRRVIEKILHWIYNVPWSDTSAIVNIGVELTTLIKSVEAADKYKLNDMRQTALSRAQALINGLKHEKQCLRLIRELSPGRTADSEILMFLTVRLGHVGGKKLRKKQRREQVRLFYAAKKNWRGL